MITKYLKTISELLLAMAEELKTEGEALPEKKKEGKARPEKEGPDGKESTPPSGEEEPITLEKLRGYLATLTANGHKDEVAALLKQYGEGKLSTVPESNYAALYAEAQKVGDADA